MARQAYYKMRVAKREQYITPNIDVSSQEEDSPQSIPAPNGGVVTYSYESTTIPAEAGLSDCGDAFGMCEGCTPGGEKNKKI